MGRSIWKKRAVVLLILAMVSVAITVVVKTARQIDGAFSFSDPNKLIVTVWDTVFSGLIIFAVLSLVPGFRRAIGMKPPGINHGEAMYLLLCFVVYLFWAVTYYLIKYGPDEYMRQNVPNYIYETGSLPYGWEETLRDHNWGVSYGFNIKISYLFSAYVMSLFSFISDYTRSLFLVSRLTSVLSGVGVGYYAILIGKKLFHDNPLRWVFVVMITFLPQIVFLSSYTNLDAFSLFVVMMIIHAWIVCLENKWDIPSALRLAAALGLCFLAYEYIFGYILMSAVLYVLWYILNRKDMTFKTFALRGCLIIAVVFVICGWKFIRNAMIYDGDLLAMNVSKPYAELYAKRGYNPAAREVMTYASNGIGMIQMLQVTTWMENVFRSLIGVFGYFTVSFDEWVYTVYRILLIIGTAAAFLPKWRKPGKNHILLTLGLATSALITFFMSVYYSWCSDYQPQGRYIITILPALFLMMTGGFDRLARLMGRIPFVRPDRARKLIVILVCSWFALTAFMGYMKCLEFFVYWRFPFKIPLT